jgi:two-component system phosphate regulon response regulator PhoB
MSLTLPLEILFIKNCNFNSRIAGKSLFHITKINDLYKITQNLSQIDLVVVEETILNNDQDLTAFLNLLKKINTPNVPIIFVTNNRNNEKIINKLSHLNIVEYLLESYNEESFLTIIISLISNSKIMLKERTIEYKSLKLDILSSNVVYMNKTIKCSLTEFAILKLLMSSPYHIFSRENIINAVWDNDDVINKRTIDVHINRIRKTLKNVNRNNRSLIRTVRSEGYCLDLLC